MRSSRMALLLALVMICSATAAFAEGGIITHNASVPLNSTNWENTITIPKYDLDPACLQSVCFELYGHVEGNANFESLDGSPTTVSMFLQATIALQRPDGTPLIEVIPLVNTSDAASAFDGVIDFAGTSGKSYVGLSGDKAETGCTSAAADLSLFCGSGNITLPVEAAGTSYGSGAGNLILQFQTAASVEVVVKYIWDCTVPLEPSTWGSIKDLFR